jgi:hypothetical protein
MRAGWPYDTNFVDGTGWTHNSNLLLCSELPRL